MSDWEFNHTVIHAKLKLRIMRSLLLIISFLQISYSYGQFSNDSLRLTIGIAGGRNITNFYFEIDPIYKIQDHNDDKNYPGNLTEAYLKFNIRKGLSVFASFSKTSALYGSRWFPVNSPFGVHPSVIEFTIRYNTYSVGLSYYLLYGKHLLFELGSAYQMNKAYNDVRKIEELDFRAISIQPLIGFRLGRHILGTSYYFNIPLDGRSRDFRSGDIEINGVQGLKFVYRIGFLKK